MLCSSSLPFTLPLEDVKWRRPPSIVMSKVDVYKVAEVGAFDFKVTALDSFNSRIFVGDAKGNLYSYALTKSRSGQASIAQQSSVRVSKAKIDRLKCEPAANVIYIYSAETLTSYDMMLFEEVQAIGKGISIFATNDSPRYPGSLASVSRRKVTAAVWDMSGRGRRLRTVKDNLMVPDNPVTMAWNDSFICCGFARRNYAIINSDTGETINIELPPAQRSYIPFVKVIGSEFYCLWENNLLIPFYSNGQTANRSPISFTETKQVIGARYAEPYLVLLTENSIDVYDVHGGNQVQVQPLSLPGCSISDIESPVVVASGNKILALNPIPITDQLSKLLKECKVDEAFALLQKSIDFTSPEAESIQEQFNLDAAWCYFRSLRFPKAAEYFELTSYDPRGIMSLFPELCNPSIFVPGSTRYTVATLVSEFVERSATGPSRSGVNSTVEEKTRLCKLSVISLLQQRRSTIFRPPKAAGKVQEMMAFTVSEYSINRINRDPVSRETMLEMLDTFLLKFYIEISKDVKTLEKLKDRFNKDYLQLLEDLFDPEYKSCLNFQECDDYMVSVGDLASNARAMLFEAFNRKVDALKMWKNIAHSGGSAEQKEQAARQTIKILLKVTDTQTVFTYLDWVLTSFPFIGLEVFTSPEELHHIAPDLVLQKLVGFDKPEAPLIERYLQFLVNEKQLNSERFHTRLGMTYLTTLFNLRPKESRDEVSLANSKFVKYKREFLVFLETSKYYNPLTILDVLRGSWFIDAEVLLYVRDKKYREALRILVADAEVKKDYSGVETFCIRQGDTLLTELLQIYIEKAETAEAKELGAADEAARIVIEKETQKYKNLVYELLKNHAANSLLDPLKVIEMIPERWPLVTTQSSSLSSYLHVALSHALHLGRATKIMRSLSEMDRIQVECDWVRMRNASVRITGERLCQKCMKKIGDRAFAVYPDGGVVHHSCLEDTLFSKSYS